MKIRTTALIAWVAVVMAIAAWWAVAMLLGIIWAQRDALSSQMTGAQEATARENTSIRLHALARDTKNLREQLDGLAQIDFLSVANMIEGVGKLTGVKVKIGNVLSRAVGQQDNPQKTPTFYEVDFLVEAVGSFSALMHTAGLFETLPVPSLIQSMEFERTIPLDSMSKSQTEVWHLITRILVLSTSDTSS